MESSRFRTQSEWERWLRKNHDKSAGIWLCLAKKESGERSISYAEALDCALCYGWIDAQKQKSPEAGMWLQRFTPRGSRSIWSKVNVEKAEALIKAGSMQPPGLAAIESAKADGRWQAAYDPQSKAQPHPELAAALAASPRARAFFETLNSQNRYAILFRTHTAKKPETRAKRIAQFIAMLERGEKLHP
jgi:uncharacterized protein YdeI (YjbR/CyaY-like superfamily)